MIRNINVGIVEDHELFVHQISKHVKQWHNDKCNNYAINILEFYSGLDVLNYDFSKLDIIFMDIALHEEHDGVEIAKQLRERQYKNAIVFVTSLKNRIRDGYLVDAIDFCTKPVSYEEIERCMNRVLKTITSGTYVFKARSSREIVCIPYQKIYYCLSSLHYTELVTEMGCYKQMITFKQLLKTMPPQFCQCHRTVIINMEHVVTLKGYDVIMSNNVTLPISKSFLTEIQKAYIDFMQ